MIIFETNTFARVWQVGENIEKGYKDLRISTNSKNAEGQREYSNWYARAVGHAANSLKGLQEGQTILITKGKFEYKKYTNSQGEQKQALNFVILEAKIYGQTNNAPSEPTQEGNQTEAPKDDDGLPW